MRDAQWQPFQVLTKSADRNAELNPILDWAPNVCMGVSVEQQSYLPRVEQLRSTGAHTKFLSIEPLLEFLGDFDLTGIDWVIVGGESGPGARPMHPDWVRGVRELCIESNVPFFFKQWGGTRKRRQGASSMVRLGIKCRRPL